MGALPFGLILQDVWHRGKDPKGEPFSSGWYMEFKKFQYSSGQEVVFCAIFPSKLVFGVYTLNLMDSKVSLVHTCSLLCAQLFQSASRVEVALFAQFLRYPNLWTRSRHGSLKNMIFGIFLRIKGNFSWHSCPKLCHSSSPSSRLKVVWFVSFLFKNDGFSY